MAIRDEIRQELSERLKALERRQGAIQRDRRREADPDWQEQATERENDEVLDALDSGGRAEIERIEAVLQRLDTPEFGMCSVCGHEIPPERLRAMPTATRCIGCAT